MESESFLNLLSDTDVLVGNFGSWSKHSFSFADGRVGLEMFACSFPCLWLKSSTVILGVLILYKYIQYDLHNHVITSLFNVSLVA